MRPETAKFPSPRVAEEAREALHSLTPVILLLQETGERHVLLQAERDRDHVSVRLPQQAFELLLEVLGQMANGNAVTIVPVQTELTVHQAAEVLNVSHPYLMSLIEAGTIPSRLEGTHRRIRFTDLMAYKRQDDRRRDQALAELTRQAEDLGLGY